MLPPAPPTASRLFVMIYGLLSERNFPARKLRGELQSVHKPARATDGSVAEFPEFLLRMTIMTRGSGAKIQDVFSHETRERNIILNATIYFLHYHNCDSTGHARLSSRVCEKIFDRLVLMAFYFFKFLFVRFTNSIYFLYIYISPLKICALLFILKILRLLWDLHFTTFETSEPYIKTTILSITGFLTSFFISPHKHREKLCVKNNKRESTVQIHRMVRRAVCGILYLEISLDRKHSKTLDFFFIFYF